MNLIKMHREEENKVLLPLEAIHRDIIYHIGTKTSIFKHTKYFWYRSY